MNAKITTAIGLTCLLLAVLASAAQATLVTNAGQNFEAVSPQVTIDFPSSTGEEWKVECTARFTGRVPTAPDNPNVQLGRGGSVVTTITPFKFSNCRIFGLLPAEVNTLAPTNWTINWNAYEPRVGAPVRMVTVAIPQNAMYLSMPAFACIVDMSTEVAPVALTALEAEPLAGADVGPRFVFTRERIPILETGSDCPHNYPFALLTGTFSTNPHIEAL